MTPTTPSPISDQAAGEPLRAAVEAMCAMLEEGEWAEHVASTTGKNDPLAQRLETAITDLHSELGDAMDGPATGSASSFVGVPDNVLAALDRMCAPLDKSWLTGVTAEEDARCMQVIRSHVLSTAPATGSAPISNAWRAESNPQAGRGLAFHRPFIVTRFVNGSVEHHCPDGRLKRWKFESEAQAVANRLNTRSAAPASPAASVPVPWENLPCYLIDKCEGQVISEEFLQRALIAMLSDPQYSGEKPFELSREFINAAKDGPDVMGFDANAPAPKNVECPDCKGTGYDGSGYARVCPTCKGDTIVPTPSVLTRQKALDLAKVHRVKGNVANLHSYARALLAASMNGGEKS